jgi:threonylcarbamoyladenosine tRNA methylthiotransferase MtaB
MPQMDRSIIKERAGRLRAKGEIAVQNHLGTQVGTQHNVLMENERMGRTEGFTEVLFDSDQTKGVIVPTMITGHSDKQLLAS